MAFFFTHSLFIGAGKTVIAKLWARCRKSLAYVSVDVDFRRGFTGQPDELAGVQGPYDHFPGLLHGPKGSRGRGVVTILYRFDLAEDFLGNTRTLLNEIE